MSTFFIDYQNGNDANTGVDWANAWQTITSGATAARIAPGDTIRIAKSPDPVSLGMTATWTNLSKTVTLASALTLEVDDCDSGWTAANSSTVTHPTTTHKEGSAHVTVTKSSYATSTLYAYKALAGSTDFSAYDALTFWVRTDAAIADAVRWKVCLCSDAAGAVIVDTFWVPAIPCTNRWLPVSIQKSGGGSLGAAIQSVAIYTGTSAPTNSQDILIDNINACTYGGLSLQSLISKSSAANITASAATWHGIQSIVGTTVLLDNETNTIATGGRGYAGTTETVTTYRRETIKTALVASASTAVQAIQDYGSEAGGNIAFSGGWNTSSGLQDGDTFFDGLSGNGVGISSTAMPFVSVARLSMCRYYIGLSLEAGDATGVSVSVGAAVNCRNSGIYDSSQRATIAIGAANNCGTYGVLVSTNYGATITAGRVNSNVGDGLSLLSAYGGNSVVSETLNNGAYGVSSEACKGKPPRVSVAACADNGTAGWYLSTSAPSDLILYDSTNTNATEVGTILAGTDTRLYSHNHDLSGYHRIFTDGGQIDSMATDFAASSGSMWKLLTSSTTRTAAYPLWLDMPAIAVVANKLVTIKAMMKKAHATQVNGRLVLPGGQIAGVSADVTATLADNTNEQELTITFTPTAAGVVVPQVWAEYVSGHAAVYIDRFTSITQAA